MDVGAYLWKTAKLQHQRHVLCLSKACNSEQALMATLARAKRSQRWKAQGMQQALCISLQLPDCMEAHP